MFQVDADSPQVRLPPPVAFLLLQSLGYILHRQTSFLAFASMKEASIVLLIIGVGIQITAAIQFRRAKTNLEPWKRSTALVVEGIFRFTRNPIYLGFLAIGLAIALALGSFWNAAATVLLAVWLQFFVITREEAYLSTKFGESYRAYQMRVSRWLGRSPHRKKS